MSEVKWVRVTGGGRRRIFTGVMDLCRHRVSFWYDLTGIPFKRIDDARSEHQGPLGQQLEEAAEERARDLINQEYCAGELCCVVSTGPRSDVEFRGYWEITEPA